MKIDAWTGLTPLAGTRWIGLILTAGAVWGLAWSIFSYARSARELPISALPADHLIQDGPYAVWRHPIYIFKALLLIGLGLLLESKGFLFAMVPAFILGVVLYIFHEERVLIDRFGDAYRAYCRRTPLLIPTLPNLVRPLFVLFFRLALGWRVEGAGNFPQPPFFVVACHRSYFDAFLLAASTFYPIRFLATFEMFRARPLRWVFSRFLCIPRRRYLPDPTTVREVVRSLRHGYCIGVFPEGERSWTGAMGPFKPEVLKLFEHFDDVPIVPVRIDGNYHAWPRWARGSHRGKVTLTVQKPVRVRGMQDRAGLESAIRAAVEPVDAGVECRSIRRALGVSKLLYRCPDCRAFESLIPEEHGVLRCRECGSRYELRPDLALWADRDGTRSVQTLAEAKERVRVTAADVVAQPRPVPHGPDGSLETGERVIGRCAVVTLSRECGTRMKPFLRGSMILTNKRIVFRRNDGGEEVILLDDIRSATVESNNKLQLYRSPEHPLLQAEFPEESVLKWQDFVVETVLRECGRTLNRA